MVSVVTTIHHEPVWMIKMCIDSIIHSEYPDIEIIVVCDCCTEPGAVEYVRYIASIEKSLHAIVLDHNVGFARAKNIGICAANGKYLMQVDADMIISSDFISRAVRTFEEHSDCWHVYGTMAEINKEGQDAHFSGTGYISMNIDGKDITTTFPMIGAGMILKSDIVECGYYQDLNISDVDIFLHIAAKNISNGMKQYSIQTHNLDCIEYKYISRGSNMTFDSDAVDAVQTQLKYYNKWIYFYENLKKN